MRHKTRSRVSRVRVLEEYEIPAPHLGALDGRPLKRVGISRMDGNPVTLHSLSVGTRGYCRYPQIQAREPSDVPDRIGTFPVYGTVGVTRLRPGKARNLREGRTHQNVRCQYQLGSC